MALVAMLVTASLFCGAAKFARSMFPNATLLELALHAMVIWWASVVGVTQFLGILGFLGAPALLAGGAIVAGVFFWFGARSNSGQRSLLATSRERDGWWLLLWAALFALAFGHVVTGAVLVYPTDWDTLMYHLPLVNYWLQAGSL